MVLVKELLVIFFTWIVTEFFKCKFIYKMKIKRILKNKKSICLKYLYVTIIVCLVGWRFVPAFSYIIEKIIESIPNLYFVTFIAIIILQILDSIRAFEKIARYKNNFHDEYFREIPSEYSPAQASFIQNKKVEVEKDFYATVLILECKKMLDIKIENEVIKISKTDKTEEDVYLTSDESYIYNMITSENKEKYKLDEWVDIIENELEKKEIYIKEPRKISKIYIAIIVITFVLMIIFARMEAVYHDEYYDMYENNYEEYYYNSDYYENRLMEMQMYRDAMVTLLIAEAILTIPIMIITILFFNSKKVYTKFGKDERKKILGLQYYMQDYSLISKRNLDEIIIWEEYIPYSIALNINTKYRQAELEEKLDMEKLFKQYVVIDEVDRTMREGDKFA